MLFGERLYLQLVFIHSLVGSFKHTLGIVIHSSTIERIADSGIMSEPRIGFFITFDLVDLASEASDEILDIVQILVVEYHNEFITAVSEDR